MTSQIKGHRFEVLTEINGVQSAILSDQVKSLDWHARRAKKKAVVAAAAMVEVRARIEALLAVR